MYMTRPLHAGFERLVGTAIVDPKVRAALLRDPQKAALAFGIESADAAKVADIRANDLQDFVKALFPRIYDDAAAANWSYASAG